MKVIFAGLAMALLASAASGATIKEAWNQPLDHPSNVAANARVTAAPSLVCSGTDECRDEKGAGDRQQRRMDEEEEEELS